MEEANRTLYEALGGVIRRRRRALDLTQDELAGRVGISRGALANIETGRQNFLLHQLYRFAAALEVDVQSLLPVMEEERATPNTSPLPLPANLTSKQKQQVTRLFVESFARKPSEGNK
jgi:transcriptional regulator with XRE-family HTH domain